MKEKWKLDWNLWNKNLVKKMARSLSVFGKYRRLFERTYKSK